MLYPALIIVIVILLIWCFQQRRLDVYAGGRSWTVVEKYDNRADAAKMLSRLHARMIKFMRYVKVKYHIDDPTFMGEDTDARRCIETLLTNYNPDVFYENDPGSSSETSYTMNKGDSMYICLRNKANPNLLEDEDTVFFVMLHECAHIANYNGWGHDERYWTVFKLLIAEAVLSGVYIAIDYEKHVKPYCGISVYYQPLFDDSLPDLI
jgi:hypothetical protein